MKLVSDDCWNEAEKIFDDVSNVGECCGDWHMQKTFRIDIIAQALAKRDAEIERLKKALPQQRCNKCRKDTGTVDGDCVVCGLSKPHNVGSNEDEK